ncbi:MAG: type 2 lantipeptide synthetase LanM family protein [Scytonematopsis contorta HA4267-MV1]|jgi:type 2 lantibiotic biosynthesis protein LanM|nr:type 2 lantipeptide synthetase LanM family protein [Scytonematopsis contorta HA4267-MV1]
MILTQSELAKITSQATFLHERLVNDSQETNVTQFNQEEAQRRIDYWCKVVAKGDWKLFQKRIEWDGWTVERVFQELGTVAVLESPNIENQQALPTWATTLKEIVQTIPELKLENISPSPIQLNNPQPFENVVLPLVVIARHKLLQHLKSVSLSSEELRLKLLSESAYLSLEKALLQKLSDISAQALHFEFSRSRAFGRNLLNLVIKKDPNISTKVQYNDFVQKLLSDGLLGFFQKYPVLGRLVATVIDFWVNTTSEFIVRLNADLPAIQQVFNQQTVSNNLGKIIEIQSDLSDPHNQGRSVLAITFESGLKLIYKPKNLGFEVAYNSFLEWCNQEFAQEFTQEPHLDFKVIKVVNRDTYGWVEYIEQKPCEDKESARNFYARAGMLLCLVYILGGNDCHNENLIACGEHPVLIDMETIMHHEAKEMADFLDDNAALMATNQLYDSVLRTGLLPMWEFGVDNSIAYDLSALGSVGIQPTPAPVPVWKCINTDDMHQGYEKMDRPTQANIPFLNGVALSPNNYLDELVTGFEGMYKFLVKKRSLLLGESSPLNAFCSQKVRFIFRPTRIYGRVLHKTMTPEVLRDGLGWSVEADILSRSFLTTDEKPLAWDILSAEVRAMGQWDIPYFSASTGSEDLPLGQEQILRGYFQQSCLHQVQNRLQNMNEADLSQQTGIIKLAFYARVAQVSPTEPGKSTNDKSIDYSVSALTPKQLLQQAQEIGDEIQERAIKGADGSLTWISLTFVPNGERFQVMPLGDSLYDGNCGVALFLAALSRLSGNTQYQKAALGAIQSLRKLLQTSDANAQQFANDNGVGGGTGLGSVIYCLAKISEFLELPYLCEDALKAAQLITPELIAADHKLEVIWGSAGAVLGLLALYEKTQEATVLEKAISCGQHLLQHRHKIYSLPNENPKGLTGFSHGAAGIAYSWLRLYEITQDKTYFDAACQAIAYENSFFHAPSGNWREVTANYNSSEPPVFWSSWCHGAPGIGLGRLGSLSIYQTEQVLNDIEAALQTTEKIGLQNIDHLCCGNLGRSEALLVGAQKQNKPQWYQAAQGLATMTVLRASQTGKYQLFGDSPNSAFTPCFFQGAAGIGYQLLRLAYPEVLPSVLLWE